MGHFKTQFFNCIFLIPKPVLLTKSIKLKEKISWEWLRNTLNIFRMLNLKNREKKKKSFGKKN